MLSRSSLLRLAGIIGALGVGGSLARATLPSSVLLLNNTNYFSENSSGDTYDDNAFELTVYGLSGTVSFTDPNNVTHSNVGDNYSVQNHTANIGFQGAPGDFGSGLFTITVGSNTVSTLGIAPVPPAAPAYNKPVAASLSGGSWSGSTSNYVMSSTSAFSLTTNSIGLGTGEQGLILIEVFDNSANTLVAEADTFGNYNPTTSTLNIAANTLTAGKTYEVDEEFDEFVYGNSGGVDTTSIPGTIAASAYARVAQFNLVVSVVPEPATYGLCAGAAILAGVIFRRRRQMAA